MVGVDLDSTVLLWNQGAERLSGWTAHEAMGTSVRQLMLRGAEGRADDVKATTHSSAAWEGQFIAVGAVLLLFTDGLVEGRHQPVEKGLLALRNAVAAAQGLDVEQLYDALLRAMGRDSTPDDDSALLAVATGSAEVLADDDVHLHLAGHLS